MGLALRTALVATFLLVARPSAAAQWSYRVVGGELLDQKGRWTGGTTGAVVVLDEAVTVRLRAGTRLRVDRRYAKLSLDQRGRLPTFVLDLERGAVDVDNRTAGASRKGVLIHAPKDLSAMSPGGHLLAATSGARSAMANREGALWVGTGGSWHALAPGLAISSSTLVVSPYPLAPPPSLEATRHAFAGITGPASIEGLTWSRVHEASRYVLRLERRGDPDPLDSMEVDGTAQPRAFPPVPPGSYVARVSAIDEQGIEGLPSAPLALRVVGVELAAGSYVGDDGKIRVVPHEPVGLSHASSLLASYGRAPGWIPAPNVVKLFRGDDTVVRVRDPRDADAFDLTLVPRRVSLRVSAGPKTIRWPGDPVRISIDASDGASGALPSTVELHPVVTVGIDRVPIEFQRDGAHLSAELPPPPGVSSGPWVVRVEVEDQFGHALGRDFVEVGVRPPPKPLVPGLSEKLEKRLSSTPRTARATAHRDR